MQPTNVDASCFRHLAQVKVVPIEVGHQDVLGHIVHPSTCGRLRPQVSGETVRANENEGHQLSYLR